FGQPGAQPGLVDPVAGPGRDVDPHHFLPPRIGHADRATFEDSVVAHHHVLDFFDRDVLAADLQHQLDPADVGNVAVLVDRDQVLAPQPAVLGEGPGGLGRLVPVTLHHVAADPGLAGLAGGDV